jgi:hypothetical protein
MVVADERTSMDMATSQVQRVVAVDEFDRNAIDSKTDGTHIDD